MASTRQDSFPRPGQRWAHFEVTGEVARGNMGVVFRARDLQERREVALKVLIVGHDDREACERFKREARSLARLSSRHIVSVHSYGVHEGIPFLTMDFVPGTTLQELFDRGAMTLSRSVDLLARIAHAMDHAHSRGVLHRDLKPANVLIGADGEPRITDFGLARLDDASASLTQDGDLIGTPVYMAPEQIRGDIRALGPSTDVWALGVMLYVALTGELPFQGRTIDEVGRRVTHDAPTPPRERRPDVPEDLERICLAALQKDPRARYQSAGELARDLEAYLRGRPVLAGRVTLAVRARRLGRALRLHAVAVGVGLAGVVLAGGVAMGGHLVASSQVERSASELLVRAVQRRAAAKVALDGAGFAWRDHDLARTAENARHALDEVAWAAAFLERAATLRLDQAFGAAPTDDEVASGLARDPVLAAIHARARALLARTASADAEAWAALEAGFRLTGDMADLEALVAAAERLGTSAPARVARRALAAHPRARDGGQRHVALLGRLAALDVTDDCGCGAEAPRWTCEVCGHACAREPEAGPCGACGLDPRLAQGHGPAAGAAREVLARAALARGRPHDAARRLREDDDLLVRAEVVRAVGAPSEHEAVLRPLLAAGLGEMRRGAAWLERARGLLAAGFPRAAREAATRARAAAPYDPGVLTGALEVDGAAQVAMGEPGLALRALVDDAAAPLAARLEALRLLVLSDEAPLGVEPGAGVADPTRPLSLARARLRLARAAEAVADGVGWLALRAEGLDELVDRPATPPVDLDALEADARLLGSPEALACVAALRLLRNDSARALALASLAGAQGEAVRRLAGASTGEPVARAAPAAPSTALIEGRAWLGQAATDAGAMTRARRALDLAVGLEPFSAAAYVARSTLRLVAAAHADEAKRRELLAGALRDGAASLAIDPAEPAARVAFLTALAAVAPDQARARLDRPGPALSMGERRAVGRAATRPSAETLDWAVPTDPEHQVALRQLALILAARGHEVPGRPETIRVADAIRRRLDEAPAVGLEPDLLHAALVLEDPTELDAWLLHRRWTAAEAEVEAALAGEHAVAARVIMIVSGLTRLPSGATPEARARARARALELLEGIARRRPGPAVSALRAAIEVWTGSPTLERADLLAHAWPGTLRKVLWAAEGGATPGQGGLWEHQAVRRLLAGR